MIWYGQPQQPLRFGHNEPLVFGHNNPLVFHDNEPLLFGLNEPLMFSHNELLFGYVTTAASIVSRVHLQLETSVPCDPGSSSPSPAGASQGVLLPIFRRSSL